MNSSSSSSSSSFVSSSAPHSNSTTSSQKQNLCCTSGFLKQYYETSTFSFLSSMKEKAKQAAKDRLKTGGLSTTTSTSTTTAAASASLPSQESSSSSSSGTISTPNASTITTNTAPTLIAHVDLDCFYASVAQRDDPTLVGRAVAVIPAKNAFGTSEVSSCSIEARRFGIKARMQIREALQLCPDLVIKTCDFQKYDTASKAFFEILWQFSNHVEPVSADEAFIDLSLYGENEVYEAVSQLRDAVFDKIHLCCSAGISHNMLLARMATQIAKPNGQMYVKKDEIDKFLLPLGVGELPGVGPSTEKKLIALKDNHGKEIKTISQLRELSLQTLQKTLGPNKGEKLYQFARGEDERSFASANSSRKSISTSISWGIRYETNEQVIELLKNVAVEISKRLKEAQMIGKTMRLSIGKHTNKDSESSKVLNPGEVSIVNKTLELPQATDQSDVLSDAISRLYSLMHIEPKQVRTVSLCMSDLSNPVHSSSKQKEKHKLQQSSSSSPSAPTKKRQATIQELFSQGKKV